MANFCNNCLSNSHLPGGDILLLGFTGTCTEYDLVVGEDSKKLARGGEGF